MPYSNSLSQLQDGDLVPTWMVLMKYPEQVPHMNRNAWELLNTLQELFPIKYYRTRIDTFLIWYAKGRDAGLVTPQEDLYIKHEMIHGAGGF